MATASLRYTSDLCVVHMVVKYDFAGGLHNGRFIRHSCSHRASHVCVQVEPLESALKLVKISIINVLFRFCSEQAGNDDLLAANMDKYRCLQLLQARANTTFSITLAAHQGLLVLNIILNIYGALRVGGYGSIVHFCSGLAATVYLFVEFQALGRVHVKSQTVLNAWQNSRKDAYVRQVSHSFRPLRFQIGKLYFVDPGMVLTMGDVHYLQNC